MELCNFLGEHVLTGCQFGTATITNPWETVDANTLDFTLDGRTFSVIENPEDGYRSSMDEIVENRSDLVITNTFPPCRVLGVFRSDSPYMANHVIDFYDSLTGKLVMSIGTENTNDYYPCFVAYFNPENMSINGESSENKRT